jgi:metal-sulfur cluster biosynthetic enzyme
MMTESQPSINQPIWIAQDEFPQMCDELREGFRTISDPEIGLNIIQLGLIRDVIIDDESALVRMILTTPFCPYGPSMMETTRQKAEEIVGRPTRIDLVVDQVWDFSMMEEGLASDWGLY